MFETLSQIVASFQDSLLGGYIATQNNIAGKHLSACGGNATLSGLFG